MLKLQVIGNLGKDATTGNHNGQQVINFSVAHTFKGAGGQEQATWVECSYWKDNAAILPYLKKGQKVYVEGTPSVREWEANGKRGVSLTLNVYSIELCGSAPQPINNQYGQPQPQYPSPAAAPQPQPQYAAPQPAPQYPSPAAAPQPQPNAWNPPPTQQGGLPF
ncbi:MAG: single-stranded DNA-binding protein [Edaphocola sp.]